MANIQQLEKRIAALEAIVEKAGLAGWVKLTKAATLVGISETTLRTQCRESEEQRRINGSPLSDMAIITARMGATIRFM